MKKYRFSNEINESIVDGIIEGYKDYLRLRKEAARNLKIHSAYAWVKGNHIDHHVAVQCEKLGVESKPCKAGFTWQYLQFYIKDTKSLFLIKNARYFDSNAVDKGKDASGRVRKKKSAYMEEFININRNIAFPHINTNNSQSLQLGLFDEMPFEVISKESAIENVKSYDRFYIVTYEIDENYLISKILLWMPNPENNMAYLVQDLSELIYTKSSHTIEMEEEMKAVLKSSEMEPDASLFDIQIADEDSEESTGES